MSASRPVLQRAPRLPLGQAALETAQAGKAGDQFQFTVKKPVSLERGRSAMLPLISGDISAERVSVYSPGSSDGHPMLGAKLANTTGMRLPAGPIAVFDGGVYAGDALLDFFPEKDSRLIVFGEDLGVTTDVSASSSTETVGVTDRQGRDDLLAQGHDGEELRLQERHFRREEDSRRAPDHARSRALRAQGERREDGEPSTASPSPCRPRARPSSSSRSAAPAASASSSAASAPRTSSPTRARRRSPPTSGTRSRRPSTCARSSRTPSADLADFQARKEALAADQARYRDNLDTVGRDSSQGQQYVKRLMDSETAIDQTSAKITEAQKSVKDAQSAYEAYIARSKPLIAEKREALNRALPKACWASSMLLQIVIRLMYNTVYPTTTITVQNKSNCTLNNSDFLVLFLS